MWVIMILLSLSLYSQEYLKMDQVVTIEKSGDARIRAQFTLAVKDTLDDLKLACAFDNINSISVVLQPGDLALPVSHLFENGTPALHVTQEISPGEYTLHLDVYVDNFLDWDAAGPGEFGTYEWEMMYENNQPVSIDSSRLTVVLPEGWNFHRVLDSAPEFKRKDPKPPYVFLKADNLSAVTIVKAPLDYRDELGLKFAFKHERKGSILIVIGVLVALLYLYFFRDLILKHITKDNK